MVSAPRGVEPFIRLSLAIAAAAAIVIGSPVVNTVRQWLLVTWPQAYVPVLAGVVALTALALLSFAVRAMRDRSWPRIAALALAVAIAVGSGAALRTGVTNVDVVEAFHFVEYSALTLLFVWALAGPAGGWAWLWAAYAAILVGAVDEWTQWFVPGRTGEIRDVAINGIAMTCGLLLARALDLGAASKRGARLWPLGAGAATVLLVVAGFFASAHLGHELPDAETGPFMSYRTHEELAALSVARARAWGSRGPLQQGQFAREDQYLSEALWHVRRRNEAMDDGDLVAAWRENRILEKYFAPVLRIATPDGRGHALADVQVAALAPGRAAAAGGRSDANPITIYTWSRTGFWTAVLAAVAVLVFLTIRPAKRGGKTLLVEDVHA